MSISPSSVRPVRTVCEADGGGGAVVPPDDLVGMVDLTA